MADWQWNRPQLLDPARRMFRVTGKVNGSNRSR
jgi:hypothetical protein